MKKRDPSLTPDALEATRIVNLPIEGIPDAEEVEVFCYEEMLGEAFERGERLFPVQVAAIQQFRKYGGGLFPIDVGWGKTGISLVVAESAYRSGVRKILLLIPVPQVGGLVVRHLPEWRSRMPLTIPVHVIAGRGAAARKAIARSNAPGVYVYPYSLLSQSDAIETIEAIAPELVIADEVHQLKNKRSARTKRLLDYLRRAKPAFVGMSGTITAKKIDDYRHLAELALGDFSPIPRLAHLAHAWGLLCNSDADQETTDQNKFAMKTMRSLLNWAREQTGQQYNEGECESYRRAFRHRFTTAPGIVSTGENSLGISLLIANTVPEIADKASFEVIEKFLKAVDDPMVTPQGEPINHAMHCVKWRRELSLGFYNSLVWHTPDELAAVRRISVAEATDILERAAEHLSEERRYNSLLRSFFKDSPPGLDTPKEVGLSISKHGARDVPGELVDAWHAWKDADFDGRPERRSIPVRLCDYKIQHGLKWAIEMGSGVIWVIHQEVGEWMIEVLREAGIDALHAPAGGEAGQELERLGDPGRGGKGDRIAVASIGSHGTGRNLQAFQNQLFLEWPMGAQTAHQTLGRLHRSGQQAEELRVDTCFFLPCDHAFRAKTLNDAVYIQQTTGVRQKVVIADYDPLPEVYTPEFLREQGLRATFLNQSQRETIQKTFGRFKK